MILFIDGEWQLVFIDDYFPYDPAQKKFVGARPHRNELWAILLEKAWIKVNGGYTNTSGGIFSEAILALTGFPTEIFKHKKLDEPREVYDLYRNIEIGYKEGSIMACGTKTDDPNVTNAGLSAGHAYSIVYPKKWKERNIYLIKLRNPWGKNEWKGNWSDYSKYWTEEFIQYFHYKKENDGTLWIELNDFIRLFDTSYICHILYGGLVKYFFFEYQTYFKKPTIFNLLLKEKATTSISILFKNFRFNREIHNSTHPFLLLLCRYNQNRRIEKIWTKWDCEDELNIVEILEPGYYCIWLNIKELNLSNFNTNNVTNMRTMFNKCSSLKELNLSNFNTNHVIDMSYMFSDCSSLNELNIPNFNTNNATDMSDKLSDCSSLKLKLSNFNDNNITDISGMFSGCSDELKNKIKEKYKFKFI